jgi:hypothetical protein
VRQGVAETISPSATEAESRILVACVDFFAARRPVVARGRSEPIHSNWNLSAPVGAV